MTNKEAYKKLLVLKRCLEMRTVCDKNCKDCEYGASRSELIEALMFTLDVLKAREPELYFMHDIELIDEFLREKFLTKEPKED